MLDDHLTADATKVDLLAARMATLLHQSKSSNAVAFREEVLPLVYEVRTRSTVARGKRKRKSQAKELATHRQTLDALLADLVRASGHVEAMGYCYRSSNRQDFTTTGTRASSRSYDWQLPALEAAGLVHRWIGFTANDDFDGEPYVSYRRATRIRATPALMVIAQRHGINADNLYEHYIKLPAKITDLIVLKTGKVAGGQSRRLTRPDDDGKAAAIRSEVERINAIYARHNFDGLPEPQVYRLFNCADSDAFDFNKGGRLYGEFQGITRDQRNGVRIDGQPVVELDLKASHLTILYGATGTLMPEGDPYFIDGIPRSVVKAVVTAMIGHGHANLTRWPNRSRRDLLVELGGEQPMNVKTFNRLYPVRPTAAKVIRRHPVLHHLSPNKLDWADLQFLESEVLVSAILELGEEYDVPALPVHDSIIVPERAATDGQACLENAFRKIVGRTPVVEMK